MSDNMGLGSGEVQKLIQQFENLKVENHPATEKNATRLTPSVNTSLGIVKLDPDPIPGFSETVPDFKPIIENAIPESGPNEELNDHSYSSESPEDESLDVAQVAIPILSPSATATPKEINLQEQPEFVHIQNEVAKFEAISSRLEQKLTEIDTAFKSSDPLTPDKLTNLKDELTALRKELSSWSSHNETTFTSKLEELAGRLRQEVDEGTLTEKYALTALDSATKYVIDKTGDVISSKTRSHNSLMNIGLKKTDLNKKEIISNPNAQIKMEETKEKIEKLEETIKFLSQNITSKTEQDEEFNEEKRKLSESVNTAFNRKRSDSATLEKPNEATSKGQPGALPPRSFNKKLSESIKTWVKFELGMTSNLRKSSKTNMPTAKRMLNDIKLITRNVPGTAASVIFGKMNDNMTKIDKLEDIAERIIYVAFMPIIAPSYVLTAAIGGPLFLGASALKQSVQNLKSSINIEFEIKNKFQEKEKKQNQQKLF